MVVAVIDGMEGGMGEGIVTQIRKTMGNEIVIIALGTNAVATEKMMKARASRGASGENAIRVSINQADFIIGPIGIALPNSMMGEITPAIAEAILGSRGKKLLLPISQNHIEIVGLEDKPLQELINTAILSINKKS